MRKGDEEEEREGDEEEEVTQGAFVPASLGMERITTG
jgi:hypothetical protein